jgi:hypothetical protein
MLYGTNRTTETSTLKFQAVQRTLGIQIIGPVIEFMESHGHSWIGNFPTFSPDGGDRSIFSEILYSVQNTEII